MTKFRVAAFVVNIIMLLGLSPTEAALRYRVAKVPVDALTIDGHLNEGYWWGREAMTHTLGSANIIAGNVDGDTDFSARWGMLWDEVNWYIGVSFYDDVHTSPTWNMPPVLSPEAVEGDAIRIFVDFYGIGDFTGYGDCGWSFMVPMMGVDTAGESVIASNKNGNEYWDVATQETNGFIGRAYSADGVNYEYECKILWNSELMDYQNPAHLPEKWFGIYALDKDGAEPNAVLSATSSDNPWLLVMLASQYVGVPSPAFICKNIFSHTKARNFNVFGSIIPNTVSRVNVGFPVIFIYDGQKGMAALPFHMRQYGQ